MKRHRLFGTAAVLAVALAVAAVVALVALAALTLTRPPADSPSSLGAEASGSASGSSTVASQATNQTLPLPTSAGLDSLPIKKVPFAEEAVRQHMTMQFGVTCFTSGEADVYFSAEDARKLDEKIAAAKVVEEGWVVAGELWLGSPDRAAKAFGASTVYGDERSVWMFMVTDNVPRGRELHQYRSESGKVTWAPLNQVSPCGSENLDN